MRLLPSGRRALASLLMLALSLVLAGCGTGPGAGEDPRAAPRLIHPVAPPEEVGFREPKRITYLLPGALSTSAIFGAMRKASGPDHLVMEYRFPGLQGQPVAPAMKISAVAAALADHARTYPKAKIEILAYSTGGAIALEAGAALRAEGREDLRIVILSGVTPFPGAFTSAFRGGLALSRAALATGSFEARKVWTEYYKTLLYGYGWRKDAVVRAKAEARAKADGKRLVLPVKGLGRAHARDLLSWRPGAATRALLRPDPAVPGYRLIFVHGGRDPVFAAAGIARFAEGLGADLCLIPEGGHILMVTHPAILRRVAAWFVAPAGDLSPEKTARLWQSCH